MFSENENEVKADNSVNSVDSTEQSQEQIQNRDLVIKAINPN